MHFDLRKKRQCFISLFLARARTRNARTHALINGAPTHAPEATFVDSLHTNQRYAATALRERGITIVRAIHARLKMRDAR